MSPPPSLLRHYIGFANLLSADTGVLTNYYGYLSCFGKVDFDHGTHNWPCKGDNWSPWGSDSKKLGMTGEPYLSVPLAATPQKSLFPQFEFVAANATGPANISVTTVTVKPGS